MPKATAVWLVDNTSLTFEQIGDFCGLHSLEVKGIADGDVAQGIKGLDPVATGQLARDQIKTGQEDATFKLTLIEPTYDVPERKRRRGPRYTPLSRRQDRPDAIYWMIRNHPEVSDAQIAKLIGTTKPTIQSIRDRSHWNSTNLQPVDPVMLGLCTQIELDEVVRKAAEKKARAEARERKKEEKAGTLRSTEETLADGDTSQESEGTKTESAEEAASTDSPAESADTDTTTPEETIEAPPSPDQVPKDSEPKDSEPKDSEPKYDADSVFAGLNKLLDDDTEDKT
jgi:hypothetical protein